MTLVRNSFKGRFYLRLPEVESLNLPKRARARGRPTGEIGEIPSIWRIFTNSPPIRPAVRRGLEYSRDTRSPTRPLFDSAFLLERAFMTIALGGERIIYEGIPAAPQAYPAKLQKRKFRYRFK